MNLSRDPPKKENQSIYMYYYNVWSEYYYE